jgi:tetratricopeptide (TPR) repeat protein
MLAAASAPAPLAPATAGEVRPGASQRLAVVAAAHPDDPDLSWALAQSLAEEGDLEAAVARLRQHLERWPERPPEASLALGRHLYALGRDAEALAVLSGYLARHPDAGAAHLHAGLAARRLGRLAEARAHFEAAARLEPELAAEAGLLAGLLLLELGDEAGARHVLGEVADRHGGGDAARAARLVLEGAPRARRPPLLSLEAFAGVQFDSNVTLESGVDLPGAGGDQDDVRFAWGGGATLRPVRGERLGVDVGVRYDDSRHVDLSAYDTRRVLGFAAGRRRLGERFALGLEGWVGYTTLDDEPYLLEGALQPSLALVLGGRAGLLRLHGSAQRLAYDPKPLFSSLERDGWSLGGGFEQVLPLPLREGAWLAWGGGYTRRDTEASRDLLGFDGAYDHDRWGALARVHLPLVWSVRADLRAAFDAERYDHANVIDGLTDGGVGRPDARKRRDDVFGVGALLTRPLWRSSELELAWSWSERDSNVDLYAYDRHVVGMTVRVFTP